MVPPVSYSVGTTGPTVKCVLHWFQMMYSGKLSMFCDAPVPQYIPVTYELSRVSCPVALLYGGSDFLGECSADARALLLGASVGKGGSSVRVSNRTGDGGGRVVAASHMVKRKGE